MRVAITVQTEDFDLSAEMQRLRGEGHEIGAVAAFIGLVRDFSEHTDVQGLYLEHYPGMTESSLERIAQDAGERWNLSAVRIIHRVGELSVGDQIVLVLVGSAHRGDAFDACRFIMDYLKVKAPFWKKEKTAKGEHWVEARQSDCERADHWAEQ